jgi:putative ABC transport system substrate-binding protein
MNRSKQAGMARKAIIVVWLVALALAPFHLAEAQQQAKVAKIGWLGFRSASQAPGTEVFLREFHALGYVEGKNIAFEHRDAEGKPDRRPAVADELVRLKVDVIVTASTVGALAAKNATRTIPVVFYSVGDPVATGLVDSLARPGGKITGLSVISAVLAGKRLELLKEHSQALPRCLAVEPTGSRLCSTMERKPTPSARTRSATSFVGGKQRRQIRGRV